MPAQIPVLKVYRLITGRFVETIVAFDGRVLRFIDPDTGEPTSDPKLNGKDAQRLSLFDSRQNSPTPLVTIGIRGINSLGLRDGKELTASARMFCFFGTQTGWGKYEEVILGIRLKVEGQLLILDELSITDVSEPTAMLGSKPLLTARSLDAIPSDMLFELVCTRDHAIQHFLSESIGLKLDMMDVDEAGIREAPWRLRIDFPKMSSYQITPRAAASFRTIRFALDIHQYQTTGKNNLKVRGFSQHDDRCSLQPDLPFKPTTMALSARDFDVKFKVTQRSPTSMTAVPLAPGYQDQNYSNFHLVHLEGLPGKIVPDQWGAFLPEYTHAIDEVLGGRPVSFTPQLSLAPPDAGGRWVMTYQVQDRWLPAGMPATDPAVFEALSLHLQIAGTLAAKIPRVRSLTNDAVSNIQIPLGPSQDKAEIFERDKGIVLHPTRPLWVTPPGLNCPPAESIVDANCIRMGALDLELSDCTDLISSNNAVYTLQLQPEPCRTSIHLNYEIAVKRALPGGQDDPDGEVYVSENESNVAEAAACGAPDPPLGSAQQNEVLVESRFRRTRPLVVLPNRGNQPASSFVLRVTEDVLNGKTLTLELQLGALRGQATQVADVTLPCDAPNNNGFVDVVVLDHDPFLVAKVRAQLFTSPSLFSGNAIASWSSSSASWQLRSDNKPFCLMLPPQGIGEEMAKDADTVADGAPVKYALSPPARFELKANLSPSNLAEAPWNLRRLLGVAGEPQTGPILNQVQYELLYGMFCGDRPQGLQLSDIFSRVGRIAPRRAKEMGWTTTGDSQTAYQNSRLDWANLYRRYLSRIAVLEPWKPLDAQYPVLKEGLSCTLRPSVLANPRDPNSKGLKGGALWGLESLNIYSAVVGQGTSGTAELAGAAFSALGAWGHQKATFNSDLTLINADAAMGRVYRYKTERLGRIGVWWNLARHVIVYERTVTPSRQFFGEQSKGGKILNMGRPMLRKIREYVEILEENRSYPDGTSAGTTTEELAAAQRRPGFVASCNFPKGAQYNVLGSWGGDVSYGPAGKQTLGWKVPLWHAGASPSDVYPKPKVTLGLHSRSGTDPVIVPGEIDDPENLHFFTVTQSAGAAPDKDPHAWDPFPDVDFSILPLLPRPSGDFGNGSPTQTLPDEVPVVAGLGSCTFRLVPALLPTNLTEQRSTKALAAILKTVTMIRAVNTAPNPPQIADIAAFPQSASDFVKKVMTSIPANPIDAGGTLPADIAQSLKTNIQDRVDKVKGQINGVFNGVAARLATLESQLLDRLNKAIDTANKAVNDDVDADLTAVNTAVQTWKASLETVLLHKVEDAISTLDTSCGAAQRLVLRYVEAAMALANLFNPDAANNPVVVWLNGLKARAAAADFQLLATDLDFVRQVRDLQNRIASAGQRRTVDWLPDPALYVVSLLNIPYKQLEDMLSAIEAAATNAAAPLLVAKTAIANFDAKAFYANQLKAVGQLLAGVTGDAALTDAQAIATAIEQKGHAFEAWQQKVMAQAGLFGAYATTVHNLINAATDINALKQPIKDAVNAYFAAVKSDLTATFVPILDKERTAAVAFLRNSLNAAANALQNIGQDLLDTLKKQIPIDQMQKQVAQLGNDIAQRANDYFDRNFRALIPDGFTLDQVENTAGKAARLVRALGEPPNVPNLDFPRGSLGYYFQDDLTAAANKIGITPVLARVNQAQNIAGQAADLLHSVGVTLPTTDILDSLIPAQLSNFNLSSIFPKFAGLNLEHLFSGLNLPDMNEKNVTITHDLDPQTRRAVVQAVVNFELKDSSTLFSIGPLVLQLLTANFNATAKIAAQGTTITRSVNGQIKGKWQVSVGGLAVVIFNDTALLFDDSSGVHFQISPANIELPGVMSFVNDLLTVAKTGSKSDGLSVGPIDNGYQCVLSLPIPDIQGATTGISNLTLGARLALTYAPFQFLLGFFLARKDAPFSLTVFILGGGGYLECDATYTPDTGKLTCTVNLAVTASASLAIALGPIKGGVYIYFGITASFTSGGGGGGLTMGALLLIRGNVDILGIVTATISLMLELTYGQSVFTARGTLSISIKICWCFTLSISQSIEYSLGNSGSAVARHGPSGPLLAQVPAGGPVVHLDPGTGALQYTHMLV